MSATHDNRGIAILRVSSARQRDNTSHEVQEKEVYAYAAENGIEIVRVARITESAKDSDSRKQYTEAVNWALTSDVGNVLFYMNDRETRNLTDNERNEKFVRSGLISIHYVRDRKVLRKDSPDSDFFMRDINAVFNKNFVRNLSAKVIDAMAAKAESGWLPTNKAPLGYMHQRLRDEHGKEMKRGCIIVRDTNEKAVRQVVREFELRGVERLSYRRIRQRIVQEGFIPSHRVRSYHVSAIEKRIKNPFYRGYFRFRDREYKGRHELIIPPEILYAVDQTYGFRGRGVSSDAIFGGGWLKCACGSFITADTKVKKIISTGETRTYKYYHCANGKRAHSSLKGMNVTEENLWEQFGRALRQISIPPQIADEFAKAINGNHEREKIARRKQASDLKLSIASLERAEDEAYRDFKAGHLDEEAYRRQVGRIRRDRDNYRQLLDRERQVLDGDYLETANSIIELAKLAEDIWLTRTPEERKFFLSKVLSNWWLDGATLRFELKKPFALLAEWSRRPEWRPEGDEIRTALSSLD